MSTTAMTSSTWMTLPVFGKLGLILPEKAEQPKHDQNYDDRPQHEITPFL